MPGDVKVEVLRFPGRPVVIARIQVDDGGVSKCCDSESDAYEWLLAVGEACIAASKAEVKP